MELLIFTMLPFLRSKEIWIFFKNYHVTILIKKQCSCGHHSLVRLSIGLRSKEIWIFFKNYHVTILIKKNSVHVGTIA